MSDKFTSVHCYGKLPMAADFIQYNMEGARATGFRAWLDGGHALVHGLRGTAGAKPADGDAQPRRYRFALDDGAGKRMVIGVLTESHDRNGLRRFPFSIFTMVPARGFRSRPALAPFALRDVWSRLDEEMDLLRGLENVDQLVTRIDRLRISGTEPSRSASGDLDRILCETRNDDFWERLLAENTAERRVMLLDILVQAMAPLSGRRSLDVPVALRLPLAGSDDDRVLQSAFWLELLTRIPGGLRQVPSIFWPISSQTSPDGMYVFLGGPDDSNYAMLMFPNYGSDYLNDFTADIPEMLTVSIGEKPKRALSNGEATLMDLVRQRWR